MLSSIVIGGLFDSIMSMDRTVLITGAAGNLGGLLARRLMHSELGLRLMVHVTPLPNRVVDTGRVEVVTADLGDPATLVEPCEGADCIVHFAGKLFAPNPKKFLPVTNTLYAENLIRAALDAGVSRFILVSFPHVEGPTVPGRPATDRLDRKPVSVHAATRLAEEKFLFEAAAGSAMEPVVLRSGMVYGRGVLMIDYARKLMLRRRLGVWRRPTWIHLISLADFLAACEAAIGRQRLRGVYNLGDDQPTTLQAFLDRAAEHWGCRRPWRAPAFLFFVAAALTEFYAAVFGTAAPLTRDFVRIGMVDYVMDTGRMREELVTELKYPTLEHGIVAM